MSKNHYVNARIQGARVFLYCDIYDNEENSITECSRFLRGASLYDDYGVNIVYDGTISSGCDAAVEMLCGIVPAMRVKL